MRKKIGIIFVVILLMGVLTGLVACDEIVLPNMNVAVDSDVNALDDSGTKKDVTKTAQDEGNIDEIGGEEENADEEKTTEEVDPEEDDVLGEGGDDEEDKPTPKKDYSRYWRDLMTEAPALADMPLNKLYMLGSHDTYTDRINTYSEPDTAYGNDFINNENVLKYFKGVVVNQCKAQADDIFEQLSKGVRYVDMRISEIDGELYNCHGLISDTVANNLILTMKFLYENPGEFIIINIQKYYSDDVNYEKLEAYFEAVTYKGKNIFDYIHYDSDVHQFSSLSYNQVTDNGTAAGVVLFSTTSKGKHPIFSRFAGESYMPFYDDISSVNLLNKIIDNLPNAKNYAEDSLMVCQAQTTPNEENILATAKGFSLLNKAQTHNLYILNCDELDDILDVFPIMQFDNVTYNENGFLDGMMDVLIGRNLALAKG